MTEKKLIITPKTKVGELLDAYPELENLLIELSPAFAKLRNPLLRKTVARVASLQQAAMIGGLKVDELVNRLRKEVGQNEFSYDFSDAGYIISRPPEWFNESRVAIRFDATPAINSGENPMGLIFETFHPLNSGEIAELKSPFLPAPILDKFRDKGYRIFSMQLVNVVVSYLLKP